MNLTPVAANGEYKLPYDINTRQDEVAIYIPASIGTATIVIGWIDHAGTTVDYADGAMIAEEVKVFACHNGVDMVATVTNYSTTFSIGYAD